MPWKVCYLARFWPSWSSNHLGETSFGRIAGQQEQAWPERCLGWWPVRVWGMWWLGTPWWWAANAEILRMETERLHLYWWPQECSRVSWSMCILWPHPKPKRARARCSVVNTCDIQIHSSAFGLWFLWEGNPGVWVGRQILHTLTRAPASPQCKWESVPAPDGTRSQEERRGNLLRNTWAVGRSRCRESLWTCFWPALKVRDSSFEPCTLPAFVARLYS